MIVFRESRWWCGSAVILVIFATFSQPVAGIEPEGTTFPLDLENTAPSVTGFALGLAGTRVADPEIRWHQSPGASPLEIESSIRPPNTDSAVMLDLEDELEAQRWPGSKTRMEAHLRTELLHQMSGGAIRYYQDGALFDVQGLIRSVKSIIKSFKRSRQPLGSRVDRDRSLIFHVREEDGSSPPSLAVLPMTLGWVGDVVVASCEGAGQCFIENLPGEYSTLLVRGAGAALATFSPGMDAQHLVLEENGILKLYPSLEYDSPVRARVSHIPTGAVVPVIRWLNPNRGEWVRIPKAGLPLLLPGADYEVEWVSDSAPVRSAVVRVVPDATIDFVLSSGEPGG